MIGGKAEEERALLGFILLRAGMVKTLTCKICDKPVKAAGNTSNLIKHLQIKYDEDYQQVHEEQERSETFERGSATSRESSHIEIECNSISYVDGRDLQRCKKFDDALIKTLDLQKTSINYCRRQKISTVCEDS